MKFLTVLFALLAVTPATGKPSAPYITGLVSASPVELVIKDAQGRRLGYDPTQKRTYNEIPNSTYFHELPAASAYDDDESDIGASTLTFEIGEIAPGAMSFTIYGIKRGLWKVEMRIIDPAKGYGNDSERTLQFSGTAKPRSRKHVTLTVP